MTLHKHIWWVNEYMEDVCKICKRSKKDLAFESIKDNSELLERLGSDYDENGVPYWEK
jgi:predicted metal-binding protein